MLKHKDGRLICSLGFSGLALLAAGLSACNQSVDPSSRGEQPRGAAQSEQAAPNPKSDTVVEAQVLQGEELAAFLKTRGPQSQAQPASELNIESKPAAKTASNLACVIDFDSPKGLSHMEDHAYQRFASSPWYIQPCFPFYALVTPSVGDRYTLIGEKPDMCVGSYGKMGHGTDDNCTNQDDAEFFPRYASKSEWDDPNMALVVTLPEDGINNIFTANSYYGTDGVVSLYGRRSNGSWIHWPHIIFDQGDRRIILAGGTNLTELDFRSGTPSEGFAIDNIKITPQ
ncbi:MAG: hypothetical protein JF616_12015 [Fibrobacteres bacterium]|jgi:hypothetical protein|nr:hypothetical protein [Fibrobacterota bacterium]